MTRYRGLSTSASVVVLIFACLLAYANSLQTPFVFDDFDSIVANPTIRHLWPIQDAFSPPGGGFTVSGRPVLNFSFACDFALSGLSPWSYHATNLALHVASALLLLGIGRRLVARPGGSIFGPFAVALIWAVHPLTTAAVTYVAQRAESLMAMFYLLTLYGVIRGAAAPSRHRWWVLAVAASALGMATKETMVSAPLVALLLDRALLARTWPEVWARRGRQHLALASTWLVLLALVWAGGGTRGGTAGLGSGLSHWAYLREQFPAVMRYLHLTVWPSPLIFDYGRDWEPARSQVQVSVLVVALLLGLVAEGCRRGSAFGWAGAAFFILLAPSSGAVPIATERIAEHRMYLPLILLIAGFVTAAERLFRSRNDAEVGTKARWIGLAVLAATLAVLTIRRNQDYRSGLALWSDTAQKFPGNAYAHNNLARELILDHRPADAIVQAQAAIRIKPDFAEAYNDLGAGWLAEGNLPEGLAALRRALALSPGYAEARCNLADALARAGRTTAAIAEYEIAVRQKPGLAQAENDLATLLIPAGRWDEAARYLEASIQSDPGLRDPHLNLGNLKLQQQKPAEAIVQYRLALALSPHWPEAANNLGIALARTGRLSDAIAAFRLALRSDPSFARARRNLDQALQIQRSRQPDAP